MPRRKLNTSPSTIDDKEVLKKLLCNPPIKKIDLHFPLGLEVTARNSKGVTIKDALDAIHKQFKKKVRASPPRPPHSPLSSFSLNMLISHDCRPTTSSTSPTSQVSSGTKRNATPNSSCTRSNTANQPPAAAARRRRARRVRRKSNSPILQQTRSGIERSGITRNGAVPFTNERLILCDGQAL